MIELMDHQKEAIRHLGNGKILWGGVGSGKSATVLAYYVEKEAILSTAKECIDSEDDSYVSRYRDIYVITTAKKRDSLDWEGEAAKFGIGTEPDATLYGVIHIDSWNNIKRYINVENAFFIFDEQRVVGHGSWVKNFIKITKRNHWILLSATPGDNWMDYAPVFVANGYYRNLTEFKLAHVLYEPFSNYPKIKGYLMENALERMRNHVLVEMPYLQDSKRMINYMPVSYDNDLFDQVWKRRWNIYEERPIKDAAELFRLMRRVVNSDLSRLETICDLMKMHDRLIIFYNFNYELDILRTLSEYIPTFEWNGHKKDPLPDGERWVYLVQYISGAESWNCISTNAMVLYSLTYSYKNTEQAQGRIDRLNTPYEYLYYYIFVSNSIIDKAVMKSLRSKKDFNERKFLSKLSEFEVENGVYS